MKKVILLCAVAALLSACGGGGGGYASIPPTVGLTGSGDTFVDSLLTVVNGPTADDTLTISVDSVALTTPDDTEPVAIM